MDISEELARLETTDIAQSQRLVQRWRAALESVHNPELLSSLLDYQLMTDSRAALRVLLGLKENHSQYFFEKVNECLMRRATRLAALRLLANMLNGQVTWLYKIVQSPLFQTLLQILRLNQDLLVLTRTVFVVTVLMPLAPYRITGHLPDLYEAFTRVATLKSSEEMERTPTELFLVLDVAVYYLFLQLYSLFPCGFLQYLRGRFGPTGEVDLYQEHIAPLFIHVQLHPSLVTELPQHETKKSKWSLWEPHELATLSLSLSLDPFLVPMEEPSPADKLMEWRQSQQNSCSKKSESPPSYSTISIPPDTRMSGLLSAADLAELWTPSIAFGQSASGEVSRTSSRMTTLSSPALDPMASASSSLQATPVPTGQQAVFKYSPTASVEVEAARERPGRVMDSPVRTHSGTNSPVVPAGAHSVAPPAKGSFRSRLAGMFKLFGQKEQPASLPSANEEALTRSEVVHRGGSSREQDLLRSLQLHPLPVGPASRGDSSVQSSSSSEEWSPEACLPALQPSSSATSSSSQSFLGEGSTTSSLLLAQEKLQDLADSMEDRSTPQADGGDMEEKNREDQTPPSTLVGLHLSRDSTAVRPFSFTSSVGSSDLLTPTAEEAPLLVSRSVISTKRQRASSSISSVTLSPAAMLEQYVHSGLLLHSGKGALPLTDVEGIDWNHFGGCPHSEELGVMTAYVAMLQSQLMFERHQCQQHSRRNRRLLSKARTASKLENEIVTLRDQLHQQNQHIADLQKELERSVQQVSSSSALMHRENVSLRSRNQSLQEEVRCYQQQVSGLSGAVEHLQEELKRANEHVFELEREREHAQVRLREADQLQTEMGQLLHEHLVLEEVYHQQQVSLANLRREDTRVHQLQLYNDALTTEKETLEETVSSLRREVGQLSAKLDEEQELLQSREKQVASLKSTQQLLMSRCSERMKSMEEKYRTVKVVNQQLESAILELRGRTGASVLEKLSITQH